ncbi:hypothetical protein JCM31447_10070 [Fluviispira sanaruensis]|uniref:Uncharacterized protein n=1 Tax=Fluviispira sanaruensis TaxID=2493639 RepID=A0A4P2VHX0_FLUSA|nr:hypothetical protein JCM31447_10070 [Fluviispira sanaruensis]
MNFKNKLIGEVIRQTIKNKNATPIHRNMNTSNIFRRKCGTILKIKKPKKVRDQRQKKVMTQKGELPNKGDMSRINK